MKIREPIKIRLIVGHLHMTVCITSAKSLNFAKTKKYNTKKNQENTPPYNSTKTYLILAVGIAN